MRHQQTVTRFEWQTEEEGDWQETVEAGDGDRPRRRLQPVAFLALLVLAAAVLALYQALESRVEEATTGVEDEVLASHEVVWRAAEQRDRELLTTFLSGRDRAWASAQEQLVEAGALFDRQGLGLHALSVGAQKAAGDEPLRVKGVELSPDLTEAEVVVEQAYAVKVGHGLTETVWLEQAGIFRPGPNRWLYSPREDEAAYWGPWSTVKGRYLTLSFPERDAAVGRRLAGDLEARLAALCNVPELSCPAGYHLDVRLDRDPASLLAVNEPSPLSVVYEGEAIRLPAPSLAGRPVDETAYRALSRGYAVHVLGVALTRALWEWPCCEHALLYRAILDEQLRRLGVQAHPLFPADFERLARERFEFADELEEVWREPRFLNGGGLWLRAQATVAFIAQQNPYASPTEMVARLTTAPTPWQWLYWVERVPEAESPAWLRFLYARAGLTAAEPPISWPKQEGLLLCRKPETAALGLFRYRPAANELIEALPDLTFTALEALPGASGVLLFAAEGTGSKRDILLYLWEDGELRLLWDSEETNVSLTYNWSHLDPTGGRLALSVAGREGDTNIMLDLQACRTGACHARVLPGPLIWSPDGRRALFVQENALLLADGDGRSPHTVVTERVASPTWLDADTFAYLDSEDGASGSTSLVAVSLEGGPQPAAPRTLLRVEDARSLLPGGGDDMWFRGVQVSLGRLDTFLITLLDMTRERAAYGLLYDWKTGTTSDPFRVHWSWAATFSPDGRWLQAHTLDPGTGGNVLALRQPETGHQVRLPQYGWPHTSRWSPDGRWLMNAGGPVVRVVAPDHGFQRVLVHDLANCTAAAWIEPASG